MLELLDAANYPAHTVEKHSLNEQNTEIEALPGVSQSFWNARLQK